MHEDEPSTAPMHARESGGGGEYYSENYPDYERQTSSRKLDFYMNRVRAWVPRGSSVFEMGVGMGHFLERAAAEYVCSGCEVNEYGLERARRRVPAAVLFLGSFESIPSHPAPRAVVSWDVLEHIVEIDEALRSIRSALPAHGLLLGVVPVYDGPLGWLVHLMDRDPTHVLKWSRDAWIGKLVEHGFEVVEHGGILRRLCFSRFYVHLTWPQALLRHAGTAIYFVARKTTTNAART